MKKRTLIINELTTHITPPQRFKDGLVGIQIRVAEEGFEVRGCAFDVVCICTGGRKGEWVSE